jgi:hypothetical protein
VAYLVGVNPLTAILSFLAAFAPYWPAIIQLAGLLLEIFGASKQNLEQYQQMIQANKDTGLVSVDVYERLTAHHQKLLDDYNKKQGAKP